MEAYGIPCALLPGIIELEIGKTLALILGWCLCKGIAGFSRTGAWAVQPGWQGPGDKNRQHFHVLPQPSDGYLPLRYAYGE